MSYASPPGPPGPPGPPPSSGSSSFGLILKVILLILLVGGFSAVLICAGIGFVAYRTVAPVVQLGSEMIEDTLQSLEVTISFLEAVRDDRLADAYAATTSSFQARTSREQFTEFCRARPQLRQLGPLQRERLGFARESLEQHILFYPLPPGEDGELVARVVLLKEGGQLRVEAFTIEPKPANYEGLQEMIPGDALPTESVLPGEAGEPGEASPLREPPASDPGPSDPGQSSG